MNDSAININTALVSKDQPIVLSSVFKSGTWLLRFIIENITGLKYIEPPIKTGSMDPCDPTLIHIKADHFYSWHFTLSAAIQEKLIRYQAKPIFLVRNVYDLAVSMYYHFANNIDHEIGRGANKHDYFLRIGKDNGIRKIITGCDDNEFKWKGIGPHLMQIESMFHFTTIYPCHLISYENIVNSKADSIRMLADFLDIPLSVEEVIRLVTNSEFDAMKSAARKQNKASHFRNGKTQSHTYELKQQHYDAMQECLDEYAPRLYSLSRKAGFSHILSHSLA